MPSVKIDIQQLRESIAKVVGEKVLPIILERTIERAKPQLIDEFVAAFRRTIVGQGLLGLHAGDQFKDVQAHLGLTDSDAQQAYDEIIQMVKQSLEISRVQGRTSGRFTSLGSATSISFNISAKHLEENIRSFVGNGSYESGEESIPWLEWLLDGGEVRDYRIVFSGYGKLQDPAVYSRSGRALMFKSSQYDWDTNDYGNFSESGKNFIEDMLDDEDWKFNAIKIISDEAAYVASNINLSL